MLTLVGTRNGISGLDELSPVSEARVRKRRSKIEIIADILRQSRNPAKKTHIMYKCSLSYDQLKCYLHFLRTRALIRRKVKAGTVTYQITEKGWKFLRNYIAIARLLRSSAFSLKVCA